METIVVGIDVSKGKRDIAVRPCGEVFSTSRDAQGLDALIARLAPLSPAAVAVEATGGFETVVAASKAPRGGGRSSAVKRLRRVACRCGESGPGPFLRAGLGQARQDLLSLPKGRLTRR